MKVGDLVRKKESSETGIIVTHLSGYEDSYNVLWEDGYQWHSGKHLEIVSESR